MSNLLPLLPAILLGSARLLGVTHPAFQAAAHVYVGGLVAAWLALRCPRGRWVTSLQRRLVGQTCLLGDTCRYEQGRFCGRVALGLSLLETAAALWTRVVWPNLPAVNLL